jgi:AAA+ superfamily predicted ATPase
MRETVRPYEPADLGRVLQLWERVGCVPVGDDGLTVDQAVDLMSDGQASTLVAERDDALVGMVVGDRIASVAGVRRLAVLPGLEDAGELADQLLDGLEAVLAEAGARRVGMSTGVDGSAAHALRARDYVLADGVGYFGRAVSAAPPLPTALAELSGRIVAPGLWEELKGLEAAKELIERRVILPLAETGLAARHGVASPRAIVLFGPPGTGKTTFAKGIASRLGWPFIEIEPSQLAAQGSDRQAKALADAVDRILELPSAVVFVDEVEDIASSRDEQRRVAPSVTNEFLKQIPRVRDAAEHLLICATNWVGRLDSAFLRPGRFDYVLPVGPPDAAARSAIWRRYVDAITDEPVEIARLADATELFTPADIEFAAHKAAQHAFEREFFDGLRHRATTEEFLIAIGTVRASLTPEIVSGFDDDTERFARH